MSYHQDQMVIMDLMITNHHVARKRKHMMRVMINLTSYKIGTITKLFQVTCHKTGTTISGMSINRAKIGLMQDNQDPPLIATKTVGL